MKKKFKVIATATVAVGMVGLVTSVAAQDNGDPREMTASEGTSTVVSETNTGCENVASAAIDRGMPQEVLDQHAANCAGEGPITPE